MERIVVLASKSPRRLAILRSHGIEPVVVPSKVEEDLPSNIDDESAVKLLALQKAETVARDIEDGELAIFKEASVDGYEVVPTYYDFTDTEFIVIGADTMVFKNGRLGKPIDRNDARRMLKILRNTHHKVMTGVAVILLKRDANGNISKTIESFVDSVTVYCRDISDDEIEKYLDSDEPYDKAGAYAIQGFFGHTYIKGYDGDFENVVGLPWYRVAETINEFANE